MQKQIEVLTWIYEECQDDLPLRSAELLQRFEDSKGYNSTNQNFNKLLNKLEDRELLEKPEYGQYDLTEKGKNFAEYKLNPEAVEVQKPEDYDDLTKELEDFLDSKSDEIAAVKAVGGELKLKISEMDKFNPEVIDEWLEDRPETFIQALEQSLREFTDDGTLPRYNLSFDVDYFKKGVAAARSSNSLEKVTTVDALVRWTTSVRPYLESAVFECIQCGDRYEKEQDSSQVKSPYKCDCGSRKFDTVVRKTSDSIWFRLEEQAGDADLKCVIRGDDLSSKETREAFLAGKKLRVTGIIKSHDLKKNSREFTPVLEVLSFKEVEKSRTVEDISEEQVRQVREKVRSLDEPFECFAQSLAPHLSGLEVPRKGVAASLIGATPIELGGKTDSGRIHCCILGNPGTGKSDLIKYPKENFSKSFYATGKNSKGVALTATVENVEGEWELRAGKAVMADKGWLSIDELDKFNKAELAALHPVAGSGIVPLDKASINAELSAEATLIAAGNYTHKPSGIERPYTVIPEQVEGFYDRFDIICSVEEDKEDRDKKISAILGRYTEQQDKENNSVFDLEEQRIYKHLARQKNPELTVEASKSVEDFASAALARDKSREVESGFEESEGRFTVTLAKLTTMIARSKLKDRATEEDAKRACKLMMEFRQSLGLNFGDGKPEIQQISHDSHIKDIIRRLGKSSRFGEVDAESILSKSGLEEQDALDAIERLKNQGELFEPESGKIKRL